MSREYAKLTTARQIEAAVGKANALINLKQMDRLDEGSVTVLAHSPIAGFGYQDARGDRHATFVGGRPGFVEVHSPVRISLELPGEVTGPVGGGVSFVFLLPGVGETLRLNGVAAGQDRSRLQVDITETYVHCARCILRSQLWQPHPPGRRALPGTSGDGPLDQPKVRDFLATVPFFVLSTGDAAGGSDTSPRGDQPGFVRILDGTTIAIPDRKGNHRADTLYNLLQDGRIALAALRPGRTQILRLHGTATVTDDPALLATMALRGMSPHAALLIDVAAAEVVESAAVSGSRLWSAGAHVDRTVVPDLNVLAAKQVANATRPGGPPRFLLKALALLARPFSRLIGAEMRSQVRKEGYPSDGGRAGTMSREMTIAEVRREGPNAVTLALEDAREPGRPVEFRAGQFFTLITEIDGRVVRRAYSASSAPGSPRLEVTVKRVADGVFSTHANRVLKVGDRLGVRGPSGTLPSGGELMMVAVGSGITPMISIIRSRPADRIALLYGNRDEESILFGAELDRLAVTHRLSRPGPGWTGERGRIDAGAVRAWLDRAGASADATYLLCGPEPIMSTVCEVLAERGIPDDRIHRESYLSAADAPVVPAGGPHLMTVEDDGRPVAAVTVPAGETLLSAGLTGGAPMPYSCTVGNCGECVVRLLGGEVAMSEPNCLTPAQRAAGYVLTCVARPASAVTVDIADPEI